MVTTITTRKKLGKKERFFGLKFKVGFNQFHCCNFGFRLKNQGDQKTRKFPLGLWIILLKKCVPGKLQSFFLQTCMYRKKSNIMVSICTCCIVKAEKCEVNAKQNRRKKKKTLFSFLLPQYFEFFGQNKVTFKYILEGFGYIQIHLTIFWIHLNP